MKGCMLKYDFVKINENIILCIDWRKGQINWEYKNYYQLPWWAVFITLIDYILNWGNFKDVLNKTFKILIDKWFIPWIHTSINASNNKIDCWFDDNIKLILFNLIYKYEIIKEYLQKIWFDNINIFKRIYNLINNLNYSQIPDWNELMNLALKNWAIKQILEWEHDEKIAFINFKRLYTLDKNIDIQAFNFDIWLIEDLSYIFNWNKDIALYLSLMLYVSTLEFLLGLDKIEIKLCK